MQNLSILFCLLASLSSCAQKTSRQPVSASQQEVFNARYVKLIQDTIKMMLIENVVIRYGELYVEADSALLDKNSQTVTAYGIKQGVFKGESLAVAGIKRISYTKGGNRIYTE